MKRKAIIVWVKRIVGAFTIGVGIKICYYSLFVPFYFSLVNLIDVVALIMSGLFCLKEDILRLLRLRPFA